MDYMAYKRLHEFHNPQPESADVQRQRGIQAVIHAGRFYEDVREVLRSSLHSFEMKGEHSVTERFVRERNDVAQRSVSLAIAVERGTIGREPAIVIAKVFGGKLQPLQLDALAACFPARKPQEVLTAFNARRLAAFNRITQFAGIDAPTFLEYKNRIRDILEGYHHLETAGLSGLQWPQRPDGQPRRSFIDRARVIDVAIDVSSYTDRLQHNYEGTLRELENPQPPAEVSQHSDVLRYVRRAGENIQAVTYDMFDTLVQWTSTSTERKTLMYSQGSEYLRQHGFAITEDEYRLLRDDVWYRQFKKPAHDQGRDFKAMDAFCVMIDILSRKQNRQLAPGENEQLAAGLERVYINIDADTAVVIPGIKTVLEELKKSGKKLAVISNHPYRQESVEELLKKFGLRQYFDVVVVSSEVGFEKSPKDANGTIFREAYSRLGIDPSRAIHVGDSHANDQQAPAKVGLRGVVFHDTTGTQKVMEWNKLQPNSPEYAKAALSAQNQYLRGGAEEYFERSRKDATPDALKAPAVRLYEMSRDYYGPLVVKFAEHTLERLNKSPAGTLNLCTGRDALAVFLVQRQMLNMYPERYPKITADQIQYMNVSRNLALNSNDNDLRTYMNELGVDRAKKIIVIDNGISGTIQSKFMKLYPGKEFEGQYLYARKFSDDPLRDRKHGFILEEYVTTLQRDSSGNPTHWRRDTIRSAVESRIADELFSADAIHGHEDIWNGISSSSEPLIHHRTAEGTRVRPRNWKNGLKDRQNFVAGNPDVLPGLENIENYHLMKRMALKGVMDALRVHRRKEQLGVAPTGPETIIAMSAWFAQNNNTDSMDRRILDGLVRKR